MKLIRSSCTAHHQTPGTISSTRSATAFDSVTPGILSRTTSWPSACMAAIGRDRRERAQPGFADVQAPTAWPPPRGRPRPERLSLPLSSLAGIGPTLTRRLASLGLRTFHDALRYRPRRYETPVPNRPIADLF